MHVIMAVLKRDVRALTQVIDVARIFNCAGGGANQTSHAMTSSENFEKGTFCGAKISQNGKWKPWLGLAFKQDLVNGNGLNQHLKVQMLYKGDMLSKLV